MYLYRFDHHNALSHSDLHSSSLLRFLSLGVLSLLGWPASRRLGPTHCDEVSHVMRSAFPFLGSDGDLAMSRAMVDLWANFAAFQDPTPVGADGRIQGEGLQG